MFIPFYVLFTFSLIASLNEHSQNCSCTADPWSLTTLHEIYAIQHIRRTPSEKTNSYIETRTAWDSTERYNIWHSFFASRIIMHRAVWLYSLPNSFITRSFGLLKKRINLEIVWFFIGRKRSETVSLIDWCIFMQCARVWVCVPPSSLFATREFSKYFTIAWTEKIHIQNSGMPFITRRVRE